jgi:hypothetical protein
MTSTSLRYGVGYSPADRAFVINDAVLGGPCGLGGETLKFRTMRAAGEWLTVGRRSGLDDQAQGVPLQKRLSDARKAAHRYTSGFALLVTSSFEDVIFGACRYLHC